MGPLSWLCWCSVITPCASFKNASFTPAINISTSIESGFIVKRCPHYQTWLHGIHIIWYLELRGWNAMYLCC